jgi:hypothetical protein
MTDAARPLPTDALRRLTTDPGKWLSCDDCFRLVDRYVDELLVPPPAQISAELAAMHDHLGGCPACAEEGATLLLLAAADSGMDPTQALARFPAS